MTMQEQTARLESGKTSNLFATGFALFSMFFGAGNLIFPLTIGASVGEGWSYAVMGLSLTAVLVPFLGLAGMIFFQGDTNRFFGRLGTLPGFLLLLLLQCILGPMGVIPRLVTLMHAISKSYLPDLSLPLFSLAAALVIFLCSVRRQNLIAVLGVILTPILLLSLGALFFFGVYSPHTLPPSSLPATTSFFEGLLGGYNTMDLIAAFLFATVVLPHFQKEVQAEGGSDPRKALFKKMFLTSSIAALLLLFTYIGLASISAFHSHSVQHLCTTSEDLLSTIAKTLLGPVGGLLASVAIITACLTTAITLTLIFSDYLRKDLCKEKVSPLASLLLTLLITTCFANLGFKGIVSFLGPILQICYPGLIVLTCLNILHYVRGFRPVKVPVFLTFLLSFLWFVWNR